MSEAKKNDINLDLNNPCRQSIIRTKFYLYVEMCESSLSLETHMKRLQNLRKEVNYLKSTDWKYEPVEKYIGQP